MTFRSGRTLVNRQVARLFGPRRRSGKTTSTTMTFMLTTAIVACNPASSIAGIVVGYYNLYLNSGRTLIANQLNTPTNTMDSVIPAPPPGTEVWMYSPSIGFEINTFRNGLGWDDPGMILGPGQGASSICRYPSP